MRRSPDEIANSIRGKRRSPDEIMQSVKSAPKRGLIQGVADTLGLTTAFGLEKVKGPTYRHEWVKEFERKHGLPSVSPKPSRPVGTSIRAQKAEDKYNVPIEEESGGLLDLGKQIVGLVAGPGYTLGQAAAGALGLGGERGKEYAAEVFSPETLKDMAQSFGYSIMSPASSLSSRPVATIADWLAFTGAVSPLFRQPRVSGVPAVIPKSRVLEGELIPPAKPTAGKLPISRTGTSLPARRLPPEPFIQKALPLPRPGPPGEPIVTPPVGEPVPMRPTYTPPKPGVQPKPFMRLETKTGNAVQFMKREYVIEAVDGDMLTLKNPTTGRTLMKPVHKAKVTIVPPKQEVPAVPALIEGLREAPVAQPTTAEPYIAIEYRGIGDNKGRARYGEGQYTTPDKNYASQFGKVEPVEVTLRKPYVITDASEAIVGAVDPARLQSLGYDGIIVRVPGHPAETVRFAPQPVVNAPTPKRQASPSVKGVEAGKVEGKQWEVTVVEQVKIGGRKTAEPVERRYTVTAKTETGAKKAVRDAGYGEPVSATPVAHPAPPPAKVEGASGGVTVDVPQGWKLEVGRTRTKEGHTYEAEVDWQNKRIVFADERYMNDPVIRNHELAHVKIETLPDAQRQTLLDEYVAAAGLDEWTVKNQFHREKIAIDYTEYLSDPNSITPNIRAVFDKHPALRTVPPPPPPVAPARVPKAKAPAAPSVKPGTGEAGKATIETILAGTGIAASAPLVAAAVEKWRRGEDNEPAKKDETLFSGGILADIGDAVSLGNYLVASIAKEAAIPGKQGVFKGVEERTAFSDVLGLAGLVPDIALDPTTYIPFAGIATTAGKLIPVGAKLAFAEKMAGLIDAAEKIAPIRKALNAFEYTAGFSVRGDTLAARKALDRETDRMIIEASKIKQKAAEIAKDVQAHGVGIDRDVARVVDAGLVNGRPPKNLADISKAKVTILSEIETTRGKAYRDAVARLATKTAGFQDDIGRMLVEAEQLTRETADQWTQLHLRRIYGRFEDAEAYIEEMRKTNPQKAQELMSELQSLKSVAERKPDGALKFGAVMQRSGVSQELKDILGEIPEASARLAAGAEKSSQLVARANMYKRLAEGVALSDEQIGKLDPGKIKGYMKLGDELDPATKKPVWGALTNKWVPEAMYYDLMNSAPKPPNEFAQGIRKIVSWWKLGKVPLSLPTQARNTLTNFVLADVVGEVSPYRIDRYAQGFKSIVGKDKWYQEALENGVFLHDTFISQELKAIVESASNDSAGLVQKGIGTIGRVLKKPAELYEFNEKWFKMAVYINARKRGMPAQMAAEFADRALFNYRKVPRAVDFMRSYGVMPFVVFPYKAIPAMARGFWENTGRLSKYAKAGRAVEEMTPDEQRAKERGVMPDWMKDTHIRLPGESPSYLNVGYLIPYADVGEAASDPLRSVLAKTAPAFTTGYELATNRSLFTGRDIVPEGLRTVDPGAARQRQIEHVAKFALPSMTPPIPGVLPRGGPAWEGMVAGATRPSPPFEPEGTPRSVGERAAYAAGLKTRKVDLQKEAGYRAWEIERAKKALRKRIVQITKGKPVEKWTESQRKQVEEAERRFMEYAMPLVQNIQEATKAE